MTNNERLSLFAAAALSKLIPQDYAPEFPSQEHRMMAINAMNIAEAVNAEYIRRANGKGSSIDDDDGPPKRMSWGKWAGPFLDKMLTPDQVQYAKNRPPSPPVDVQKEPKAPRPKAKRRASPRSQNVDTTKRRVSADGKTTTPGDDDVLEALMDGVPGYAFSTTEVRNILNHQNEMALSPPCGSNTTENVLRKLWKQGRITRDTSKRPCTWSYRPKGEKSPENVPEDDGGGG